MSTRRLTDLELRAIVQDTVLLLGTHAFWTHRPSGTVYVKVGVTLREADLTPLVRYYPHGRTGFEFCRPIDEFLDRFVPCQTPAFRGLPAHG